MDASKLDELERLAKWAAKDAARSPLAIVGECVLKSPVVLELVAAAREAARLKALINDFGYDCLPECDSTAHAEKCPHVNFAEAYELRTRECEKLREQLRRAMNLFARGGES